MERCPLWRGNSGVVAEDGIPLGVNNGREAHYLTAEQTDSAPRPGVPCPFRSPEGSRLAFRIVPLSGAYTHGVAEDDSLYRAEAVGRSDDE